MTTDNPHRVAVVGGGYAGVLCANRLAGKLGRRAHITLVNPRDTFVERLRLHEVAAREDADSATKHSLRSLLRPSVELRLAHVTSIKADERLVEGTDVDTDARWEAPYDKLVYAVGSGAPFDSVPGAAEHSFSIASIEAARSLRARLNELPRDASVLVVGGGATAVELVTELAGLHPTLRLSLITASHIAPTLSDKARGYLRQAKAMRNVQILEHAPVSEVTRTGVRTTSGREIPADCVIWAASFAVPPLAKNSGLEVDRYGRLVVDEFLQSRSHPDVLGAGDAIVVDSPMGETLRMACATAAPQGGHAAATIMSRFDGRRPEDFRLAYLVLAMSLGPGDGLVQKTYSNDLPTRTVLTGKTAALFNEFNNRYARSILSWERVRSGTYRWAKPSRTTRWVAI